jgi:hypothetical protein
MKRSFHSRFIQHLFYAASLLLLIKICSALPVCAESREDQIAALNKEKNEAIFGVEDIVNQPVTHLKRTPDMIVANFPGWFDPGATKPDFNTVDVRATQEFVYEGYQYVTSDLNPGVVFTGNELEFNSMTKYFITDRSVPKKKLTEAEMLEINQFYRIIGHCEQQLDTLQHPEPFLAKITRLIAKHKPIVVSFMALLVIILLFVRKRQTNPR